jgi:glycosyltransferase involved in cell wall biosynthesis
MPNPLITVVIPAFNAGQTIERALRSVLSQTYRPLQVIVVDDASTDQTSAKVTAFGWRDVELVRLDRQAGAGMARNAGILRADGDYVAFLDADDEWLPEKTCRQFQELHGSPGMTFIAASGLFVPSSGKRIRLVNAGWPPARGPAAWKTLLAYSFVNTSSVLARRRTLAESKGFDPALVIGEDQDLWIRLARLGDVGFLDDILVRCYETPESLTKRHSAELAPRILDLVEGHIAAVGPDLTERERRWIRSCRFARLGRTIYSSGHYWEGAQLIIRAVGLGYPWFESLWYLAVASAPMNSLRAYARSNAGNSHKSMTGRG